MVINLTGLTTEEAKSFGPMLLGQEVDECGLINVSLQVDELRAFRSGADECFRFTMFGRSGQDWVAFFNKNDIISMEIGVEV